VRAWLLSILRNRFIDQCRRRAREKREESEVAREQLAAAEGPDADPPYFAITTDALRAAVEKLTEEFRAVYRLHALEGRSYIEIADRLQIPKATVGTRLIRARRKLRDLLQAQLAEAI
jgi:RNA polymerase sigma-70 factor (ECF subfamily)